MEVDFVGRVSYDEEETILYTKGDPSMVVLITSLIIALLLLLFILFVWMMAVRSQTPRRKLEDRTPGIPYEEVTWQAGDSGQPISGWFIPAPSQAALAKPAPAIVIAHGWSSNRSSMLRYADRLHAAGYALLLYDARGHGVSGEVKAASGITMRDDLRSALTYISKRPEVDRNRIGVLGHSMGAFASVLALGGGEHRIKALVTDAMPSRLTTMVASELARRKLPLFPLVQLIPIVWWLRTGIPRTQYDPILAIDQTIVPILMVHSRNDDIIPWTELDFVLRSITRKVKHLYTDTDGHSSSFKDDAYWTQVLEFFDKKLASLPVDVEPKADLFEI